MEPTVSYIVSAYDRPFELMGVISSLLCQADHDCNAEDHLEIIVTDNAEKHSIEQITNEDHVKMLSIRWMNAPTYLNTALKTCYHSAEEGAKIAKGKYLCFPSDDSYYVPRFQEFMVQEAESRDLQLVYCDMLFDGRRMGGKYGVLDVHPQLNHIDKTGFLVRRDVFEGFKEKDSSPAADGYFIEELVRRGIRHGKVPQVLAVHN